MLDIVLQVAALVFWVACMLALVVGGAAWVAWRAIHAPIEQSALQFALVNCTRVVAVLILFVLVLSLGLYMGVTQ